MAFRHRMSDLILITPPSRGMAEARNTLWEKTLQDAKEFLHGRDLTDEAYEMGCASIDALTTKSSAEAYSSGALKTYRYSGETQTRALLSAAYEDKLPFQCSFQWSAAESERRLVQLSWLLKSVTAGKTSRLIRGFPVALVASMMDIMANTEGREITWWDNVSNREYAVRKTCRMMKGFKNLSLPDSDVELVNICLQLFHELGIQLPHFDNERSLITERGDIVESEFGERMQRAANNKHIPSQTKEFVFVESADVNKIYHLLKYVDRTMSAELSLVATTQNKLLNSDYSSAIPIICHRDTTDDGHQHMFCLDHIFIEMMRMISDMSNCIRELKADDNADVVCDLMEFCGEYWDKKRTIHVRKLFMLAIVMIEGVDVEKIDNSYLVSDIVEKIDDEGAFIEGRKKRIKTKNREVNARRMKRGPSFRPRIQVVTGIESDYEEALVTKNQKKRAKVARSVGTNTQLSVFHGITPRTSSQSKQNGTIDADSGGESSRGKGGTDTEHDDGKNNNVDNADTHLRQPEANAAKKVQQVTKDVDTERDNMEKNNVDNADTHAGQSETNAAKMVQQVTKDVGPSVVAQRDASQKPVIMGDAISEDVQQTTSVDHGVPKKMASVKTTNSKNGETRFIQEIFGDDCTLSPEKPKKKTTGTIRQPKNDTSTKGSTQSEATTQTLRRSHRLRTKQ